MCQAIPRRVLRVDGGRAEVDYDGKPTWVEASAVPNLVVGEYVVVYAGQALDRMATDEAEAMLQFYADLESMLEEGTERLLGPAPAGTPGAEAQP
jgi:hydrogenase expression/formation protein HypC